jgi:hypothetical protein
MHFMKSRLQYYRNERKLIVVIMLSCLAACAHVTMYNQAFPPRSPDAVVDVFRTQKPSREYIEIASIRSSKLNRIINKARELGADGLIIVEGSHTTGAFVPVGDTYIYSQDRSIEAIAIKYK